MSITFNTAVRNRVSLLVSISGGTGSGKSMSALRVARGLASKPGENLNDPATLEKVDARIKALDTESGRLLHYAPAPGEKPSADTFGFLHGEMKPPFTPESYTEAIAAADDGTCEVIVVDSGSHVWAGEGGVVDHHDEMTEKAVQRAEEAHKKGGYSYPFDHDKTWERLSLSCWAEPKMAHKRFVSRLLQCRAHIILCLRADEKLLMETVEETGSNGKKYKKTIITAAKDRPITERWQPVAEKRLAFEFSLSLLLVAENPGFPIPLKLEERHKSAVPLDKPLSEETGQKLAEWARGGAVKQPAPRPKDELVAAGEIIAATGSEKLGRWWQESLSQAERVLLRDKLEGLKGIAAKVTA